MDDQHMEDQGPLRKISSAYEAYLNIPQLPQNASPFDFKLQSSHGQYHKIRSIQPGEVFCREPVGGGHFCGHKAKSTNQLQQHLEDTFRGHGVAERNLPEVRTALELDYSELVMMDAFYKNMMKYDDIPTNSELTTIEEDGEYSPDPPTSKRKNIGLESVDLDIDDAPIHTPSKKRHRLTKTRKALQTLLDTLLTTKKQHETALVSILHEETALRKDLRVHTKAEQNFKLKKRSYPRKADKLRREKIKELRGQLTEVRERTAQKIYDLNIEKTVLEVDKLEKQLASIEHPEGPEEPVDEMDEDASEESEDECGDPPREDSEDEEDGEATPVTPSPRSRSVRGVVAQGRGKLQRILAYEEQDPFLRRWEDHDEGDEGNRPIEKAPQKLFVMLCILESPFRFSWSTVATAHPTAPSIPSILFPPPSRAKLAFVKVLCPSST